MGYLTFLFNNWRFVGFGYLLAFSSSYGQTFFVALSGADIRAEFGLTHGSFGSWYAVATIGSALSLIWVGRLIDQIDLRLYTGVACAVLTGAVALTGVSTSLFWLVLALFLARLTGQGLMMHISGTSMARYFPADRGKAISLATMGLPTGEALLPMVMVALIAAFGWRDAWLVMAAGMAVAFPVLLSCLLRGHGARHLAYLQSRGEGGGQGGDSSGDWTRAEVVRDPRFYMLMSGFFGFPFIATGLFFHQAHIATVKGWSLELIASAFIMFAAMRIVMAFVVGPAIDRFSARRVMPVMFVPLAGTVLVVALSGHPASAFVYMGLLGLGGGLLMPIVGAIWAELYGVAHLGAIRALVIACLVFASATAPPIFGWALDAGIGIEAISWACLAYTLVTGGIAGLALKMAGKRHSA